MLFARLFVVLAGFRVLGWPIARAVLPRLPASAYALAGTIGLVLATHVTWLVAHAGLALGPLSIAVGLMVVLAAGLYAVMGGEGHGAPGWPRLSDLVSHHLVFGCAFLFAVLVTARNPSVDPDSERFMDYAMYNAVLASSSLPLEDPWLAGMTTSYYDYGYYAAAYLATFTGSPDAFFLVAIALIYASLAASLFALGRDLMGWSGALAATWMVAVAGNLDALRQTVRFGLEAPLDWFQSARVLAGGITEFPFFALLWGDLHPYAIALPLWPLLLALAYSGLTSGRWLALGTTAVAFSALLATQTWDAVPMAVLLVSAGLVRPGERIRSAVAAVGVVAVGAILAIPYLVRAPTGGRGFALVTNPSDLGELGLAWGASFAILLLAIILAVHRAPASRWQWLPPVVLGAAIVMTFMPTPGVGLIVALLLASVYFAWQGRGPSSFAWVCVVTGLFLVLAVELVHVDDFYEGDLARMNTVFKAYVEAWVLLGVGSGLLLAEVIRRGVERGARYRVGVLIFTGLLVGATAIYPIRSIYARTGDLTAPIGLDPTLRLSQLYPDEALVIASLRSLPRGSILETTGDPYSWHSRFASYTGYPTVVGWAHHEQGWRNDWEMISGRVDDVHRAYESDSIAEFLAVCEHYRIRYVVVGELERERYPAAALAKLEELSPVIESGRTTVYQLEPQIWRVP